VPGVRLKALRYDPAGDPAPHFETYSVEYGQETTVLDALIAIKDGRDGSLSFRHSCHRGACGSCAMRINDQEQLACVTRVAAIVGEADGASLDEEPRAVRVEPLANLPVLQDLVVDMAPFWRKFNAVTPYILGDERATPPTSGVRISQERTAQLQQVAGCIQCGACYSACPILGSDQDYLGPAALATAFRFAQDPRDAAREERLNLVGNEQGVLRCHTIFNCTTVCPVGVEPTAAIQQLKRMMLRQRLGIG